ncbi:MAG: hypothetical protein RLZ25_1420 [Pseudomonadota bacterium]
MQVLVEVHAVMNEILRLKYYFKILNHQNCSDGMKNNMPPPRTWGPVKNDMSGMAVVETAIVAPLILFLLFGVSELGLVLYDKALVTAASRSAARAGVVYAAPQITDAQIIQSVNALAGQLIPPGVANTSIVRSASDPLGPTLQVTVSYSYQGLVLPALSRLFGVNGINNTLPVSSTTTMYME